MSQDEQIEELMKIDEQFSRCDTDEQKQFVKDNLDALIQVHGYDKAKEILRSEVMGVKIIELFKQYNANYGEMMNTLSQVLASTICVSKRKESQGYRDFRQFALQSIAAMNNTYSCEFTPEQIKFMRMFGKGGMVK